MKHGLLLINLGTPDNSHTPAVIRYLCEFLADKRVVDLPAPIRYLLLYGLILPFRSLRTAHAYQAIWTPEGSPLLLNGQKLVNKLQDRLGENCNVALGMRYGKPTIKKALNQLQHCETITILPLFPQYSSAASGSSIEKALQVLSSQTIIPSVKVIRDFHSQPSFIEAQAELIKSHDTDHDFLLFSYHGLPENHLLKSGCKQICVADCPPTSLTCYRAQCLQTSALIAKTLGLNIQQYESSFQSRLGKTPWIKPYTDEVLIDLIARGIRHLAIVCPSFVADCLETLEEIGIRTRQQWMSLGGKQLTLIPCLNDSETWVNAVIAIAGINDRTDAAQLG